MEDLRRPTRTPRGQGVSTRSQFVTTLYSTVLPSPGAQGLVPTSPRPEVSSPTLPLGWDTSSVPLTSTSGPLDGLRVGSVTGLRAFGLVGQTEGTVSAWSDLGVRDPSRVSCRRGTKGLRLPTWSVCGRKRGGPGSDA